MIHDTSGDGFAAVCTHGWSDEDYQLYREHYAAIDLWGLDAASKPESFVGTDTDACSREVMEASVAYREFYAPRNAIHGMIGIVLVTGTGQSLVSALRGAKEGPFGETEKAILRPLMRHLKRAALLHGELGFLRRQLATFTGHLNQYSDPFFLTDTEGRVLYANAAAREISGLCDGLSIENERLTITASQQGAAFRRALIEASASRGGELQRVVVSRPSGRRPYYLILMPVEESGAVPLGVAVPAVSILVVDAELRREPNVPFLCELFSLTPAEARVAGMLALGKSVEEIAEESEVAIATVRTHIKRTLAKTGTERQGELISLILRSTPVGRQ
jgi:DNA-binding CsgD family transcriptional regulator/PAS domain-containing protein